ncbi:hypothetical protein [Flavobacterium crassostreae]|uniref:Uncharacterized protein n=1 Tax=Flavobacterium crassostreae TaxID=1763534 RepID=A0A1B9E2A6_9FLAO|nr:hypothetical protein [Flavobacterium crassostreae]OCB76056.1 hypothetical protein LPBF_07020 [Flavobacterium crassostreae]
MKNKTQTAALHDSIAILKQQQSQELALLKEDFQELYQSVKPANLLQTVVNQIVKIPDLKNNLLNSFIGLSTGYLSKKIMFGTTKGPIKKIVGTVVQFLVTNFVSKQTDTVLHKTKRT